MKIIDKVTFKFLLVGVINTLVGTSVMFVAYNILHTNYWVASASNYIIGSMVSYILNKNFTFQNKDRTWSMIVKFVLNISVCYLLAYGIAKPAVYRIMSEANVKIRDNVAMLCGMCLFLGLNYFGQRYVVFKKH